MNSGYYSDYVIARERNGVRMLLFMSRFFAALSKTVGIIIGFIAALGITSTFAQATLKAPITILLKNKPAPVTVIIPFTSAQASGKKYTYHWGRDTIEQTKEILLAPLQTIFLPVLKNKKGEIIKPRPAIVNYTDGKTITKVDSVWEGGIVLSQLPPLGGGGASNFTNYTTDNGLALDAIGCGYRDKTGNLWFGTNGGGVSRYDGSRANHPCNKNTCKHDLRIQQDLKEHDKELAKSFTNFTTAQGLANNTVHSITEDKNRKSPCSLRKNGSKKWKSAC